MDRRRLPRSPQSEPLPRIGPPVVPGVPLWQLAPTRDAFGARLCDFMVLIPRLKTRQAVYVSEAQGWIARVLGRHDEVVFANLDLNLNLLWVSHRYRAGLMLEIVGAIRSKLPEAVLVAHSTR